MDLFRWSYRLLAGYRRATAVHVYARDAAFNAPLAITAHTIRSYRRRAWRRKATADLDVVSSRAGRRACLYAITAIAQALRWLHPTRGGTRPTPSGRGERAPPTAAERRTTWYAGICVISALLRRFYTAATSQQCRPPAPTCANIPPGVCLPMPLGAALPVLSCCDVLLLMNIA